MSAQPTNASFDYTQKLRGLGSRRVEAEGEFERRNVLAHPPTPDHMRERTQQIRKEGTIGDADASSGANPHMCTAPRLAGKFTVRNSPRRRRLEDIEGSYERLQQEEARQKREQVRVDGQRRRTLPHVC